MEEQGNYVAKLKLEKVQYSLVQQWNYEKEVKRQFNIRVTLKDDVLFFFGKSQPDVELVYTYFQDKLKRIPHTIFRYNKSPSIADYLEYDSTRHIILSKLKDLNIVSTFWVLTAQKYKALVLYGLKEEDVTNARGFLGNFVHQFPITHKQNENIRSRDMLNLFAKEDVKCDIIDDVIFVLAFPDVALPAAATLLGVDKDKVCQLRQAPFQHTEAVSKRENVMPTLYLDTALSVECAVGDIKNQTVDVILNLVDSKMQLDKCFPLREVPNEHAIMQQECLAKAPEGLDPGDIAVTTAGTGLLCKYVYHGNCYKHTKDGLSLDFELYTHVLGETLVMARQMEFESVAINLLTENDLSTAKQKLDIVNMYITQFEELERGNEEKTKMNITIVGEQKNVDLLQMLHSGVKVFIKGQYATGSAHAESPCKTSLANVNASTTNTHDVGDETNNIHDNTATSRPTKHLEKTSPVLQQGRSNKTARPGKSNLTPSGHTKMYPQLDNIDRDSSAGQNSDTSVTCDTQHSAAYNGGARPKVHQEAKDKIHDVGQNIGTGDKKGDKLIQNKVDKPDVDMAQKDASSNHRQNITVSDQNVPSAGAKPTNNAREPTDTLMANNTNDKNTSSAADASAPKSLCKGVKPKDRRPEVGPSTPTEYPLVEVVHGKLLDEKVDCIVHGTKTKIETLDDRINFTDEVGKAILDRAIKNRTELLQTRIKNRGTVVSEALGLPYKHIMHVNIIAACHDNWDTFLYDCLKRAEAEKFKTMSFPPLGIETGGQLNILSLAQFFKKAVDDFRSSKPMNLKNIRVVLLNDSQVSAFQQILDGTNTGRTGPGVVTRAMAAALDDSSKNQVKQKERKDLNRVNKTNPNTVYAIRVDDKHCLTVEVAKGDIVAEATTAIVHSTDYNISCATPVGQAILSRGGQSFRRELERVPVKWIDNIFPTPTNQNFHCNWIIHLDVSNIRKESQWTTLIYNCLLRADALEFESISFPALGTGKHGASPKMIAKCFKTAFRKFVSEPRVSLKSVRLVIFQESMIPNFTAEFDSLYQANYAYV